MSKIELNDSFMDMVAKMSEGNTGAMMALMEVSDQCAEIDPQSAFGPYSVMLSLDTDRIYGSDIYVLYNDKCGKNARKMCLLTRAVQLGIMPLSKLQDMASDQTRSINLSEEEWSEIDESVCSQLESFQKPNNPEQSTGCQTGAYKPIYTMGVAEEVPIK